MSERFFDPTVECSTLVDLLRLRALHQPDRSAYTFLVDGETEEVGLTYGQLDGQARAIGASLQDLGAAGERVLLLYPPGLGYIAAFFGCLYAGAVAVPSYPPRLNRPDRRLQAIVADAQAMAALTTARILSNVERRFAHIPSLEALRWLNTDDLINDPSASDAMPALGQTLAEEWRGPGVEGDTLAFLQYTSGSTAAPKGVMVSHSNLMHNLALIHQYFEITPESQCVIWLPPYHDMGLIGGILQPLYGGWPVTLMSPLDFLQRPLRWLQAISRYRATHSGGPNFAYDLCVDKITPDQKVTLDLSSWDFAFSGAEPVRYETLERFAAAFEPCGFRWEAFYPCYGLAEATLIVSGGLKAAPPVVHTVQGAALGRNQIVATSVEDKDARTLVGCGQTLQDQEIVIVDPESFTRCPSDQIGEVWISGPSVGQGYWNRPEETEHIFRAYLADNEDSRFLRTGDLGFLKDGELFITGRLKDLIIIRGRNHYPQDIELTVEQSHPALRPSSGAACSVDIAGEERLVIVQEVKRAHRKANMLEIARAIRQAVVEQHDVEVYAVVLVSPMSIPKTSSGKIQRHACRNGFLDGTLKVVGEWIQEIKVSEVPTPSSENQVSASGRSAEAIQTWLISYLSRQLEIELQTIDIRRPFASYGLSSMQAVGLSGDLENWLGCRLSPVLAWEYPSIEALSKYLGGESNTSKMIIASTDQGTRREPVAVIGIGCRFPGAEGPETFWRLLRDGVDAITEVPPERWDVHAFYDPDPDTPGKSVTRWGGYLEQVDQFDPHFFGISPREAARMDPQQRLLLEVAWEALENAGQAPSRLQGTQTGVFIGISSSDYSSLQLGDFDLIDSYTGSGNAHSVAANRLSYLLDLRGPSLAVDTACSSSLVALHLACQSLHHAECDLALAGGVNLILTPHLTIAFSKAHLMAADGRCKAFDAGADGYVRSEGCGVVVLKRLTDAIADRDNVLAIVRGSAVNHDGLSNGLTAPNGLAQQAVVRQALANAGVLPNQISYVEAHGTGTRLGDPIEVNSLKTVLMDGRLPSELCAIGSVKTNIGHLEAAAGVAGFIKTVLALCHQEIPPHLHLKELNPHVSLEDVSLFIPTERQAWPNEAGPRLAGVSSFGFGGTNAHVILEEAPSLSSTTSGAERTAHLLTLSAQSEDALRTLACRYEAFVAAQPEVALEDVCFTANSGRPDFVHRLAVTADSTSRLRERLAAFGVGRKLKGMSSGQVNSEHPPKVAFLFAGQGSQYVGMGCQLYETQPTFRQVLDQCNEILRPYLEKSLLSVLYRESKSDSPLGQTAYTQPTLFAIEYALFKLWQLWGVKPDMVMGHSIGEYVAACVAGVFSLEDGLKLVAERGKLMQALPQDGEMVSIMADEAQVVAALTPYDGQVSIAAANGPASIVVSGERVAVQAVAAKMKADGIRTKRLMVSHAFHSSRMEPMLDDFERVAAEVVYSPPQIELVSNLTGQLVSEEVTQSAYWRRHTREPVRFAASIETLYEQGCRLFVEIAPQPMVSGMGARCVPEDDRTCVWLPSLRKGRDEWQQMLNTLGVLYVQGVGIDWEGFDRDYERRRIALPTYPFERRRCWFESSGRKRRSRVAQSRSGTVPDPVGHPLLGEQLSSPLGEAQFESDLSLGRLPFLSGHQIYQMPVLPLAGYVEMAVAAAAQICGSHSDSSPLQLGRVARCLTSEDPGVVSTERTSCYELTELIVDKPLVLTAGESRSVQLILATASGGETRFEIYSRSVEREDLWILHAGGKVCSGAITTGPVSAPLEEVRRRCREKVPGYAFYQQFDARVLACGPEFQGIENLWLGNGEALGQIHPADSLLTQIGHYRLSPALATACFHVLVSALPDDKKCAIKGQAYVPVGFHRLRFFDQASIPVWSHAVLRQSDEESFSGDLKLYDEVGRMVAEVSGLRFECVTQSTLQPATSEQTSSWFYKPEWHLRAHPSKQAREELEADEMGGWLVFSDRGGVGSALVELLEERGGVCVTIFPGERFEALDQQQYKVNPENPEDFRRLFEGVAAGAFTESRCRGIVHLWGLDTVFDGAATAVDVLQRAQIVGCGSALLLVHALAHAEWSHSPRIWFGTRGTQPVGAGVAPLQVAQAPLWGLGRVIALEHPKVWGGLVDFDPDAPEGEAAILLQEICMPTGEDQIAFRGERRYVCRLVPESTEEDEQVLRWYADVTYLITGGLGGLGLAVARWMVEQGARHLILTSRKGLPERACWESISHDSEIWRHIQAVRALEELGAEVEVVQADVSNWVQMSAILETLQDGHFPLRGVVHAAGVSDPQALVDIKPEMLQTVLCPKVIGGWILHRLTQEMSLDFFVSFSSIASVLGSARLGHYAAANHFLDALAYHRQTLGLPGLSVNWGPWTEIGMTSPEDLRLLARIGMEAWSPAEGINALGLLLQKNTPQVVAAKIKWSRFIPVYAARSRRPILEQIEAQLQTRDTLPAGRTALVRQLEKIFLNDRQRVLTTYLQNEVADTLELEASCRPDPRQGFFEMGMDSLMAIELAKRVEMSIGHRLPRTIAFEFPSIEAMVGYLLGEVLALDVAQAGSLEAEIVRKDEQTRISEIKRLSADNVEKLLLKELEELNY